MGLKGLQLSDYDRVIIKTLVPYIYWPGLTLA